MPKFVALVGRTQFVGTRIEVEASCHAEANRKVCSMLNDIDFDKLDKNTGYEIKVSNIPVKE